MDVAGTAVPSAAIAAWDVERLDLEGYLARLGLAGAPVEDAEDVVRRLHRAHVAAIPFENLDVVLGRGIALDLEAVQAKLVRRRRGGYCFEHTVLYAAALERLGHRAERLTARVRPDTGGSRTHQLVAVEYRGRWWISDVGFGGNLLEPLPLAETTVRQGGWTYRLVRRDARWRLELQQADGWLGLYEFTTEPAHPVDLEIANHYTSTHPRSPFVGQLVVFDIDEARRRLLKDHELTTEYSGGHREREHLSTGQVLQALAGTFGLHLEAAERQALADHLDAHADQ